MNTTPSEFKKSKDYKKGNYQHDGEKKNSGQSHKIYNNEEFGVTHLQQTTSGKDYLFRRESE